MKSLLLSILITLALVTVSEAAAYKRIKSAELQSMLASDPAEVIVDVREPELFERGHIPGAINIPYDGAKTRILKELKPEDVNVFVCHGGPMGDTLAKILIKNGFDGDKVYNLKGGMYGWKGPTSADR